MAYTGQRGITSINGRSEDGERIVQFGLQGMGAPSPFTLHFSDARAYMRGITVVNQSTILIGLYLNRTPTPGALPDISVFPYSSQGMPLPSAKSVGVGFLISASAPPGGSAYFHYTTDLVSNTSGPATGLGSVSFIWDESLWNQTNW